MNSLVRVILAIISLLQRDIVRKKLYLSRGFVGTIPTLRMLVKSYGFLKELHPNIPLLDLDDYREGDLLLYSSPVLGYYIPLLPLL